MITKEDLVKIKAQTLKTVLMREHHTGNRLLVEVGDNGLENGARELVTQFLTSLTAKGIYEVAVIQTDQIHDEKYQVCVILEDENNNRFVYHSVTQELAERIVVEHIMNHKVITDHILKDGE